MKHTSTTLLTLVLTSLLVACSIKSDVPRLAYGDDPSPLQVTGSAPASGVTSAFVNGSVVIFFNKRVDQRTVTPETVRLLQGDQPIPTDLRVDHLDCAVVVRAASDLEPNQAYSVEVDGLQALGAPSMRGTYTMGFTTGSAFLPPPQTTPPDLDTLHRDVLAPRCGSCHSSWRPPAGLDLSSPDAAAYSLILVESYYQDGELLVVPGYHGRSYLMHKLLGLPGSYGDTSHAAEDWPIDRGCRTPDPDLRRIAAWIDGLRPAWDGP